MKTDGDISESGDFALKRNLVEMDSRSYDFGRLRPDWVFETNADLQLVYTSHHVFEYFGLPQEAAVGKHLMDFGTFIDNDEASTLPDLRTPFRGTFKGTHHNSEGVLYLSAATLPFFASQSGEFRGIRGSMLNVTGHRATEIALHKSYESLEELVETRTQELNDAIHLMRAERSVHGRTRTLLDESREQFQIIAETSPVAIFLSEIPNQKITFANRAASEMLSISVELLLGLKISSLFIDTKNRRTVREFSGPSTSVHDKQLSFRTPDGTLKWGQFSTHRMVLNGRDVLLTAVMDVTELRNIDRQLLHTAKLATLGELSASIAHEINQPLSAIGLSVESAMAALDDEDSPDIEIARTKLIGVLREQRRLVSIIDRMRKYSRKHQPTSELLVPLASCQYIFEFARDDFAKQGIELTLETNLSQHLMKGNATSLEQVLLNILTNARDVLVEKLERLDGQTDFKAAIKVSAMADSEGGDLVIRIVNNGEQIPQDTLPKIFLPFFTTKGESKGTGLGLSISKRLIEDMSGIIHAENTADGAAFVIELPLVNRNHSSTNRSTIEPEGSPSQPEQLRSDIGDLRILVVEDSTVILREIQDILAARQYTVSTAENGKQALQIFKSVNFDLVITDLQMPVMDGVKLIQEIRQINVFVPIVVISSSPEKLGPLGGQVKINAVLQKPFDRDSLLSTIDNLNKHA